MRTIPPALQAHLNTGATTLCWAWRITRSDGTKYGFSDHDLDMFFEGTTFAAASGFTASQIKESVGLNVDNIDADAAFQSDALSEGDLAAGLYDGATVELWRVNWADTSQRVLIRKGSLGEVRRKEGAFTAELRGLAHFLNQNSGRTFSYACDAALGDARCKKDLAAFTATGAVTASPDTHTFTAAALAGADSLYASGLVTWTSGANAGATMEVQRHTVDSGVASITLWHDMPRAIAPGDAFTIIAGCDKLATTCQAKFANIVNFRGFNRIPGDDIMLRYPNSTDARLDGTSMYS